MRAIVPDISWQDLYWAPREQVDLQASYKVRPGVSVFTQVQNLTHARLTSLLGPNQNLLKDTYSVPTTFWMGVRFTPVFLIPDTVYHCPYRGGRGTPDDGVYRALF